jgi:hypothetical protein
MNRRGLKVNHSYRGWTVSWSRLEKKWYAWDSQRHIKETRVTARSQEEILRMVEGKTPNYKSPIFAFMG